MLSTLRTHRSRPGLHFLVLWLLVSLVAMLTFSICAMPLHAASSNAQPADCSGMTGHDLPSAAHDGTPAKDCSFKPCLASQSGPAVTWKLEKPALPVLLLGLAWSFVRLPRNVSPRPYRAASPPPGRPIPLIFRFCTLLN